MKEEIEMFLKRAEKFEKTAKFNFENKDFDIAMFNIEQAFQLLIKAKLLEIKGSFQKTHSLRKLIEELINSNFKRIELSKFLEKNKKVLRDLERAYITSRYLYEEFLTK